MQLSTDGLRVLKNTMIQGKMLMDYIPMPRLQFFTIMKNSPDILFVVSLSGHPTDEFRYKISVFRMSNAMDASIFAGEFKRMSAVRQTVRVVKTTVPVAREEDINWTLRSKEHDNSKRELRQIVDIDGEKTVVTKVTDGEVNHTQTNIIVNGHTDGMGENDVRIPIYRKGKPTRLERESFESDFSDNRSEVSESALRMELESLSQEIRGIKMMLEKSTGITASSEPSSPSSPRGFEPVNVKVHTQTIRPETVEVRRIVNTEDNIDAVVVDEDKSNHVPKMNGYTVANGDVTHVRVSVPDYRSYTETTGSVQIVKSTPVVQKTTEHVEMRTNRPSTTSYENWKKNTIERNAVKKFDDFPERIQWRSRSSRPTHVVSTRPRSAIPSWSTDATDSAQMVEVRHHSAGVGPSYHRVSFNPRVVKVQDRKAYSLRARGLSSTVVKPIEQVYTGRLDAKHHSLSLRPHSATLRPSILVKDHVEPVYIEQNNNVIKTTDNDDTLLDVSGIDLYKETPIEGAVIRT